MGKKRLTGILLVAVTLTLGACGLTRKDTVAETDTIETGMAETSGIETNDASVPFFPEFASVDLEGTAIDSSIFANNKLTMINFWGTFCGPCIVEMPYLGKLAENMPEGVELLGVIVDGEGNIDAANEILTEANASFRQIMPDEAIYQYCERLIGVPTTIFVDREGKIIGESLIGVRSEEAYRSEIESRLKEVE